MKLRPSYQVPAVEQVLARFDGGEQRTLVVLPTGAGKTVVAGHVAKTILERCPTGRVMVLAHRDELIRQAADKFHRVTGFRPAIEKGEEWSDEDGFFDKTRIVVSSFQTQNAGKRRPRMQRFNPRDFAFLWVDEAHHALADTYRRVIDYYANGNPDLKVLGVTATADRGDGEALGQVFQSVAYAYQMPDMIADGYLVGVRQMRVVIEGLNLSKCRTTAGDINQADAEAQYLLEKPLHGVAHATIEAACGLEQGHLKHVADDADRVSKLAAAIGDNRRRRTLVFTAGVVLAQRLAEIFNRWIPGSAAHVDGAMPLVDRQRTLADFAAGRLQFLSNCMVCTEGYDEPGIELVVCARPTKSRALYCQMVGRGTRPLEVIAGVLGDIETADGRRATIAESDKPHVTVLDFVGNSGKHKLVTAADLLGDERYDPAVVERAAEIAAASDGAVDVQQALDQAQAEVDAEQAAARADAEAAADDADQDDEDALTAGIARRMGVVATASYAVREVDPFNHFDTSAPSENIVRRGGASEKQVKFIVSLSRGSWSMESAMALTAAQASGVIGKLKAARDQQRGAA